MFKQSVNDQFSRSVIDTKLKFSGSTNFLTAYPMIYHLYECFIIRQPVIFFTKNDTACEFFTNFFTNCDVFCEEFCEILSIVST